MNLTSRLILVKTASTTNDKCGKIIYSFYDPQTPSYPSDKIDTSSQIFIKLSGFKIQ